MRLMGYSVDLSFVNTPCVCARVAIPDPVTGKDKIETLDFFDDEARALVAMVANPDGEGLVNHPDGLVDGGKLRAAVVARITEATQLPEALAARVAAAEEARRTARAAEEQKRIADVERAQAESARSRAATEMAAALAAVEEARAEKAALDAEIAAAKAAQPVPEVTP